MTMTIWARSDVVAVNISEAHGGCGTPGGHRRPVEHGAPAKVWGIDCPQCSDHLRHDPHWSSTIEEVPETYDETKVRENFEKRGAKDKDAILTLALARLAGIDSSQLPDSLTRMVTGVRAHVPGMLECPSGHEQPTGQKFCGECGAAMHGTPQAAAITQKAEAPNGKPRRLRDARADELQALARQHDLSDTGTRGDLISRLSAAGVTNNDLARLTPVAA